MAGAYSQKRIAGPASHVGEPAHHLHDLVEGDALLVRPGQEALVRDVDQAWVRTCERFVAEPEPLDPRTLEDGRMSQMSGGQQQRVAVARAMVTEPALILADEPTANLDSASAIALLDVMEQLNRTTGTTFLFSTHDPQVMERAHRLIRLRDGQVVSDEARVLRSSGNECTGLRQDSHRSPQTN